MKAFEMDEKGFLSYPVHNCRFGFQQVHMLRRHLTTEPLHVTYAVAFGADWFTICNSLLVGSTVSTTVATAVAPWRTTIISNDAAIISVILALLVLLFFGVEFFNLVSQSINLSRMIFLFNVCDLLY